MRSCGPWRVCDPSVDAFCGMLDLSVAPQVNLGKYGVAQLRACPESALDGFELDDRSPHDSCVAKRTAHRGAACGALWQLDSARTTAFFLRSSRVLCVHPAIEQLDGSDVATLELYEASCGICVAEALLRQNVELGWVAGATEGRALLAAEPDAGVAAAT